MKCYLLSRGMDSILRLCCQALVKGKLVETFPAGPFDIGNGSKETQALALAILLHYYGAPDAGAEDEAQRKKQPFLEAFLLTHSMPSGAKLEISSDVIDRFVFLSQIPVSAR